MQEILQRLQLATEHHTLGMKAQGQMPVVIEISTFGLSQGG